MRIQTKLFITYSFFESRFVRAPVAAVTMVALNETFGNGPFIKTVIVGVGALIAAIGIGMFARLVVLGVQGFRRASKIRRLLPSNAAQTEIEAGGREYVRISTLIRDSSLRPGLWIAAVFAAATLYHLFHLVGTSIAICILFAVYDFIKTLDVVAPRT